MNVTLVSQSPAEVEADAVVVGLFEGEPLNGPIVDLDKTLGGPIRRLLDSKEISGKHAEITTVLLPTGMNATRLLIVGLGEREQFDRGLAFRATASVSKALASKQRQRIAFFVSGGWDEAFIESGICGA